MWIDLWRFECILSIEQVVFRIIISLNVDYDTSEWSTARERESRYSKEQ